MYYEWLNEWLTDSNLSQWIAASVESTGCSVCVCCAVLCASERIRWKIITIFNDSKETYLFMYVIYVEFINIYIYSFSNFNFFKSLKYRFLVQPWIKWIFICVIRIKLISVVIIRFKLSNLTKNNK